MKPHEADVRGCSGPSDAESEPAFAVVAGCPTPTNQRLVQSCWRLGVPAALLRPEDAESRLSPNDVALARLDVLPTLDGVERGLDVLCRLAARRVSVLNSPEALLAAHDKAATAQSLTRNRIPHPRTMLLKPGNETLRLSPPLVLKPRFGSWGRDVFLCLSRADLHNCLHQLRRRSWFRRHGALVQEYVPAHGDDLRLLVARGRVIGAIRRVSKGEWRTNVTLGARREPTEPPPQARILARAAAAALRADFVGVDLLPLQRGRFVVLEVNGAVDFTDEYGLSGSDVFEHAARQLTRHLVRRDRWRGSRERSSTI